MGAQCNTDVLLLSLRRSQVPSMLPGNRCTNKQRAEGRADVNVVGHAPKGNVGDVCLLSLMGCDLLAVAPPLKVLRPSNALRSSDTFFATNGKGSFALEIRLQKAVCRILDLLLLGKLTRGQGHSLSLAEGEHSVHHRLTQMHTGLQVADAFVLHSFCEARELTVLLTVL